MKAFVIGYEHPKCDKRTFRSVQTLSRMFDEVYYQYLISSKMSICELPENVIELPREKAEHSTNVIHWWRKWRRFDEVILREISKVKPDLVYLHAMPLTMWRFFKRVKKIGAKVMFEVHEVIPDQFGKDSWRVDLIRGFIWKAFGKCLRLSDGLIFVSEESAKYMLEKLNMKRDFLIIPNYALETLDPLEPDRREKEVVIVGGARRRLPYEIANAILESGFRIKVIGNIDTGGIPSVEKLPFMDYREMMRELSKSFFSLMSYRSSKKAWYSNDVFSLPSKFFDSLAAGVPVLVESYFVSMSEMVRKLGVGIVFSDAADLKKKLSTLNLQDYEEILENLKIHQRKFVWDDEKDQEYADFIRSVMR